MENTTNIKLLDAITKHLHSLEDAFYYDIPIDLLKNENISNFSHTMDIVHSKIITLIKNNIINDNINNNLNQNIEKNIDLNLNIDYSQLESLSKKI